MSDNTSVSFHSPDYRQWLSDIKSRFQQTQLKASVQVNSALLHFYWELGEEIVKRQKEASWGSGFIPQLSQDLAAEFPEIKGFSERNIKFIRQWYCFYSEGTPIGKQPVSQLTQIPWGHNIYIVQKCATIDEALFYVQKTIANGWSRSVLTHQYESGLYQREGKAITNFDNTLPDTQSDLARQVLKDPYTFDFLSLTPEHTERRRKRGRCSVTTLTFASRRG